MADDTVAPGDSVTAASTTVENVSGVMDESGEVAQINVQHHRSERLGEQGVDGPVPQILQALVYGIGDAVEQMVDVDVMGPQIVEDVVEHADEMECFLEQIHEKSVDEPMPQIPEAHVGVLEANRVEEKCTKDAEHSCQERNWNASPCPYTFVAFTTAAFPFSSKDHLANSSVGLVPLPRTTSHSLSFHALAPQKERMIPHTAMVLSASHTLL